MPSITKNPKPLDIKSPAPLLVDSSGAPLSQAVLPPPEADQFTRAADKTSLGEQRKQNAKRHLSDLERARSAGELPHEFFLRLMRTGQCDGEPIDLDTRLLCADKAAPYFAPRLSTINMVSNIGDEALLAIIMQGLNDPELAPLVERIVAEAGLVDRPGRVVATQGGAEAEVGACSSDAAGAGEQEAAELGDGREPAVRSDQPVPASAGLDA